MLRRKSDTRDSTRAVEIPARQPGSGTLGGAQAAPGDDELARFRAVLLRLGQRSPRRRVAEPPASISVELEAALLLLSTQPLAAPWNEPH